MNSVTRLQYYGFLSITGKDAMKFLQGYATCDLTDVSANLSAIGATCNLQGRMVASFQLVAIENGYLLRMHRELVPELMTFLKKYIVFSKAEMHDLSDEFHCFGVMGAAPGFPESPRACALVDGNIVIQVGSQARYEVWSPSADFDLPGSEPATEADWISHEIDDGIAWVSAPTANEFIPQMFRYHEIDAIDFEKGCYLGQEIVARIHFRGNLNRSLHRGNAERALQVGDPLNNAGGKHIGTVVSAAQDRFLAVVQSKDNVTPASFLEDGTPIALERVSA